MSTTIEAYLAELRVQLAGADPALVQDALYDAEEYLRSEAPDAADAAAVEGAIERYGSPEEVASAYRETELTVARALRRPEPSRTAERGPLTRFFGVVVDPYAYAALFYMILSLATGIIYFTVAVTGLSLSVSLSILIVGVPIILLFLGIVRAISLAEGRMVEGLLGIRMPRRPRIVAAQGNLLERIKSWFTDYRTWTTILYMVLQLPLGIVYFTLFTVLLSVAAAFVVGPIAQMLTGQPLFVNGDASYLINAPFIPVFMAGGVLLFFVSLHLARLIGKAHAAYAKVMLVGRTDTAETTTAAGQAA